MKRFFVLAATLLGVGAAPAADPLKPAVEFRLKSVLDLLPYIEYGGELAGKNNEVEQVTAIIKEVARQKMGLEGIDLTKPFGGYVLVTDNIADSAIVLMVPASTEDAFLGLLTDRAMLKPKKEDDGSFSMDVPNFPASVHLRFADGYAYLGFRSSTAVAKKNLLAPKDFFAAKHDGLLAATVHFDRIPADLRKNAYGQIEFHLNDAAKPPVNPVEKALQKFLIDRFADVAKAILTDADKLSFTVAADPKADDVGLELALTPRKGTTLAKTLNGWADRPSAAASVSQVKGAAFAAAVNFALPSETKAALGKLVDLALGAAVENAGPVKGLAKQFADALAPTLKSGELELGGAVVGPDDKGKFGGVAAVRTVGGDEIKKLVEAASVLVPLEAAKIALDTEKVGDGQRHTASSAALTMIPKFGSDTVHLFTSDSLFAAALAPKPDGLKAAVTAKPGKTPMLFAEASAVKLFQLFHDAGADKLAKLTEDAFGKPVRDGDDVIRLTGQGGDVLRLKLSAKGRALAFLRVIGQN